MKKLIVILLIFQVKLLLAQNLVLNPGFETLGTVPCGWSKSSQNFDEATSGWTSPTDGTPDIITTPYCSNYRPHSMVAINNVDQAPHSGISFASFYTYASVNIREYIERQLSVPLTVGESYIISMYVSLGDNSVYASNNIGINFYTTAFDSLSTIYTLGIKPLINHTNVITDTANWVLLSDTFVDASAWQYFIIGNFYDNNNTRILQVSPKGTIANPYYYIDDVSVTPLNNTPVAAFYTPDTSICNNNCITFNNLSQNATSYQWSFPGGNPSSSTNSNPGNVCYNAPGRYNVQLIASNGSVSDTSFMNGYISVNAAGKFGIVTESRDSICEGSGITVC